MTPPHYVLSALGMVNALGITTDQIWHSLIQGEQKGFVPLGGPLSKNNVRVGRVPINEKDVVFPEDLTLYHCRNNALVFTAFEQIKEKVTQIVSSYGAHRVGVVLGSSTSGVGATETAFAIRRGQGEFPKKFHYVQHELGGVSEFLGKLAGIRGPTYTLSTACSSSAKAFASARALLRDNWCDAVIVGGADSLCRLTVEGFMALEAISPKPSNSMSKNRNGFVVGEGAALFVLEKHGPGIELWGVGESSDAYHMSAPRPDGGGAMNAMTRALQDARVSKDQIRYINLHGTGTVLNDQMEARAVAELFPKVSCSSTKAMTGHTLGAAGAMEVGLCWLTLTHASEMNVLLPPHLWDGHPDESLPLLNLVRVGDSIDLTEKVAFLSNSFGFGGSNCSVIIGQGDPR
ncbi:MAG: beta-ketoacyl-ACP synthase [Elusimicrobia bacterium]|jgi:3-oxoacyl-[acyl-carrier-protein] synthase-1|nr:beta-ketoacyl-ACP synthase [Elusimicrobiota bacterium]